MQTSCKIIELKPCKVRLCLKQTYCGVSLPVVSLQRLLLVHVILISVELKCPDGCRWDAATSVGVQFTKIQMKGVCLVTAN